MRFRIRDLLTGKTLIESTRGRDLVAYWQQHYRPGYCDWWWQYESTDPNIGWAEIPSRVKKAWLERSGIPE